MIILKHIRGYSDRQQVAEALGFCANHLCNVPYLPPAEHKKSGKFYWKNSVVKRAVAAGLRIETKKRAVRDTRRTVMVETNIAKVEAMESLVSEAFEAMGLEDISND